MKTILFLLLLVPLIAWSQDQNTSTDKVESNKDFKARTNHWLFSIGAEKLDYPVPFEFSGEKKSFKKDEQELYGGRLGVGREFYLHSGFMTATKLEGFYVGTLFEKRVSAAPEEGDVEVSFVKKTGHIWGGEVAQSLSYMWNIKVKNPFMEEMVPLFLEPFVEVGIGKAVGYNRLSYRYHPGNTERYTLRIDDQINVQRLSVGVNITSLTGHFFFLKGSRLSYDVTDRKLRGEGKHLNGNIYDIDQGGGSAKLDSIFTVSLGGGVKF